MSRSNPNVNSPNPALRWFEWNGEHGIVRYYDRELKKNVDVPLPFTFLLLDEVASVRGWHDSSDSGIYSNEVKDTRTDVLLVKSFKGGIITEGLYKDIKDRVNAEGGQYVANCYIAFKQNGSLAIGSLRFKGAALGAWMECRKSHRGDLYTSSVTINGYTEGKKGKVVFRVPTFITGTVSEATNASALDLDKQLQEWLAGYFARRTSDQPEPQPAHEEVAGQTFDDDEPQHPGFDSPLTDDDIPFSWLMPLVLPMVGLLGAGLLFA